MVPMITVGNCCAANLPLASALPIPVGRFLVADGFTHGGPKSLARMLMEVLKELLMVVLTGANRRCPSPVPWKSAVKAAMTSAGLGPETACRHRDALTPAMDQDVHTYCEAPRTRKRDRDLECTSCTEYGVRSTEDGKELEIGCDQGVRGQGASTGRPRGVHGPCPPYATCPLLVLPSALLHPPPETGQACCEKRKAWL